RLGLLYAYVRGADFLRGSHVVSPAAGARRADTIEVVSDAESAQHSMTATFSVGTPPPPAFGDAAGPLVKWNRAVLNGSYTLQSMRNNTDGDFMPPPSGAIAADWGPAAGDVRHRVNMNLMTQTVRNLAVLILMNASSGA